MIRRLFGLAILLMIIAAGAVIVKSRMTRANEIDLEIAACNKISDPIARAAAYEADPEAAKAEVKQDPQDIGNRLALAHLSVKAGDYVDAVHHMEVVAKLQPDNHNYQLVLCGLLIRAGRNHEAAHRLENMGINDDRGRAIARAAIDNLLPSEGPVAKGH